MSTQHPEIINFIENDFCIDWQPELFYKINIKCNKGSALKVPAGIS